MIPIFPLMFGVAILALGKKKRSSKRRSSSVTVNKIHAKKAIPSLHWNDDVAQRARESIVSKWEAGDQLLSGGKIFVLMRDTAMELWPYVKWPVTMNDEARMTNVSPGRQIPTWVYNLGDAGLVAQEIWWNIRSIVWDVTRYEPPL